MLPPLREQEGFVFLSRLHIRCSVIEHECVHNLWTPYTLCHFTTMNIIYARYTQGNCQCRLLQQIIRQLVSWTVVGLTTTKFKPLIIIFLAFTPKSYLHFSSLPCITTEYFLNYYVRPPNFNTNFYLHQRTSHLPVTSSIWVIFVNQALSKPTPPAVPYLLTILWSMLSRGWRTKWFSIWFSIKYSTMQWTMICNMVPQ
jgi:hypothetical protein